MRKERPGHTLQTTALVNEAYLKLVGRVELDWQNRSHFFGIASQLMRHILVDHARGRRRGKRGDGTELLPLTEGLSWSQRQSTALIALDDALAELAKFDPRKARVVELRYFGGLTAEETAEVLDVHPNTVKSDWSMAKIWLKRELSREATPDGG